MLKVGVVGVGGISRSHIAAWSKMKDVELVALCDVRQGQLDKYPDKRHYLDLSQMLEEEALDILDICLPTYLHVDAAMMALEKGIHVLCEKPISLNLDDVDRVYFKAREKKVNFMVAQVLRFWPEYMLIKELYDTRKYGKLLSAEMRRLNTIPKWSWNNWMRDEEKSGHVPFDLHIHDLDFMVYAFGAPDSVRSKRIKRPGEDCINVFYEYPEFYIQAECAWYAAPYPFKADYRFHFENAVITYEDGKCIVYEVGGKVIDLSAEAEGDTGSINLPKSNAYADEIRYFADCVTQNVFPDRVKPEELKTVIEIISGL